MRPGRGLRGGDDGGSARRRVRAARGASGTMAADVCVPARCAGLEPDMPGGRRAARRHLMRRWPRCRVRLAVAQPTACQAGRAQSEATCGPDTRSDLAVPILGALGSDTLPGRGRLRPRNGPAPCRGAAGPSGVWCALPQYRAMNRHADASMQHLPEQCCPPAAPPADAKMTDVGWRTVKRRRGSARHQRVNAATSSTWAENRNWSIGTTSPRR